MITAVLSSLTFLDLYPWELALSHSLGCSEKRNYLKFFCMTNEAEKRLLVQLMSTNIISLQKAP